MLDTLKVFNYIQIIFFTNSCFKLLIFTKGLGLIIWNNKIA